jgi:hypothetical protein
MIGNRLSVAAGVALAAGMLAIAPRAEAQVQASGGTITRYRENTTNFIAHIFTNSAAAQTFTPSGSLDVEYLIVAGGGSGGGYYEGGGGGAGGFLTGWTNLAADTYTVTVGGGGKGINGNGTQGTNSSLTNLSFSVVATGGGSGGQSSSAGGTGGSGGGATYTYQGGSGTAGQGYNGANCSVFMANGGGGGGAGGPGFQATNATMYADGGPGRSSTLRTGTPITYAAGGKGNGRVRTENGSPGDANTGNGGNAGAGSTGVGGNGGSGIVIVRYVDSGTFTASVAVASATAQWPFQAGAFTITRPDDANTSYAAVVSYTMTGTATNGVDYSANLYTNSPYPTPTPTPLSGYATLGVGVTQVVVNVYPLHNPPFSAKTATLTLNVPGNPAANVAFQGWVAGTVSASGGTLANYPYGGGTNWTAHIFTNGAVSTDFTVTSGGQVEYLVVAGGGGGGYESGGGGAGGVRFGVMTLPAGTYTMAVGDGGRGATGIVSDASNGGSSRILGSNNGIAVVRALGGGYGGSDWGPTFGIAGDGGSGGGANYNIGIIPRPAGKAVGGVGELGYDGGTAQNKEYPSGGGGAGSVGLSASPYTGGSGTNLAFTGVTVEYGRGGSGGPRTGNDGVPGTANTGNGGNGGGGNPVKNGGKGGSGIVVVRYLVPPPPKGTLILFR